MASTVTVTEKVPGMDCTCRVGSDCSEGSKTAKYECIISDKQMQFSGIKQVTSDGIRFTSNIVTLLAIILLPIFGIIAVARLIFYFKKSDRLKTTFKISIIFFSIALFLYLAKWILLFLAPWVYR